MKGQKTICLYDSELKKNKFIGVNKSLFESEEKLNEYISKMKKEQKDKNQITRNNLKKQKYEEFTKNLNNTLEMIPKVIIDSPDKYIPISSTFKLKLDTKTGNSTAIIGSSKQGKSTLLMKIYDDSYAEDKEFISTLFTINPQIGVYKHHKNLLISDCFNETSEKYIKLEKFINTKTKNKYKFLNMFDDIIDTKYTKLVNELILTYRNSNMSTIISLQYGYLISKMNRANINNIIIFRSNTNEAMQDTINIYLKPYFVKMGFKTFEDQMQIYNYVTNNHGFFYIHPQTDSISFHRLNLQ
jgi:ABC-type ATPase with predicted acetyltransferase domain